MGRNPWSLRDIGTESALWVSLCSDTRPHNNNRETEHCVVEVSGVTEGPFANLDLLLQDSALGHRWC